MLQSKNYITGTGISRGDANKLREDSLSFVLGELQVNALQVQQNCDLSSRDHPLQLRLFKLPFCLEFYYN